MFTTIGQQNTIVLCIACVFTLLLYSYRKCKRLHCKYIHGKVHFQGLYPLFQLLFPLNTMPQIGIKKASIKQKFSNFKYFVHKVVIVDTIYTGRKLSLKYLQCLMLFILGQNMCQCRLPEQDISQAVFQMQVVYIYKISKQNTSYESHFFNHPTHTCWYLRNQLCDCIFQDIFLTLTMTFRSVLEYFNIYLDGLMYIDQNQMNVLNISNIRP